MSDSTRRRAQILRKAARALLEHGYDGASMDVIAAEAGLTKRGLYYHFKSKQELLFAVMTFAMDELEKETLAAMVRTETAEEKLRAILETHARMITREHDRTFTLLITTELGALEPEDRRVVVQRLRSYRTLLQATLEQLAEEGRLRAGLDPTVAAQTLMGMVAWLSFWYRPEGRLTGECIASMVADQALASVVPDAQRSSMRS